MEQMTIRDEAEGSGELSSNIEEEDECILSKERKAKQQGKRKIAVLLAEAESLPFGAKEQKNKKHKHRKKHRLTSTTHKSSSNYSLKHCSPLPTFPRFEELPLELHVKIFSFLESPQDVCNFSLSCRKWHSLLDCDNTLWKNLCLTRWKSLQPIYTVTNWKQCYQQQLAYEKRILESPTPGVTAISIALQEVYGVHPDEPWLRQAHYHSPLHKRANEPIDTLTVYSSDTSIPHWHYVTWGLSELNQKEPHNLAAVSGWGFELSFRLAKTEEEKYKVRAEDAPEWPIHFIQSLARYVCRTSNVFGNGDHMPLSKPLGLDTSNITALLFTNDTQLRNPWKNPNGHFQFIQIVGVTEDELEASVAWNKKSFLNLMAQCTGNPLLVTDLHRNSLLADPDVCRMLHQRTREEGSTQGLLFVEKLRYTKDLKTEGMLLEIPPLVVPDLLKMLKGRIQYQRDFFLVNTVTDSVVNFMPTDGDGENVSWKLGENMQLTIQVSEELAAQLQCSLRAEVGEYCFPSLPNFKLKIVDLLNI